MRYFGKTFFDILSILIKYRMEYFRRTLMEWMFKSLDHTTFSFVERPTKILHSIFNEND